MMVVGPCKRCFRTSPPCPEGILTLKFKTRPHFEGYLQPRAMQTRPSRKLPRRNSQKKETGAIKYKVYVEYIRASGGITYWTIIMAAFAICVGVYLGRSWWISLWTRSYQTESGVFQAYLGTQRIIHSIKNEFQAISID